MVNVIFSFEVAKENQEEFLNFVKAGTKPWWESHGCLGYNVWQAAGENAFIKIMEFPDMATMQEVMHGRSDVAIPMHHTSLPIRLRIKLS